MLSKSKIRIVKFEKRSKKDSDMKLAASLQSGDEKAFDSFYARYSKHLYTLAVRLSGNEALAEEMFQEVMMHILKKIHLYNGTSTLATWLHRVCVNFYISFLRNVKQIYPFDEAKHDHRSINFDMVDMLDIRKGLQMLSEGYRQVIVLHDVEGYTHQEIARLLGINVGTSKSQLHYARLRLRDFLKGDE